MTREISEELKTVSSNEFILLSTNEIYHYIPTIRKCNSFTFDNQPVIASIFISLQCHYYYYCCAAAMSPPPPPLSIVCLRVIIVI